MSISLSSARQFNAWPRSQSNQSFFTMASLRATEYVEEETRKAVDLVVCLDRSGSMSGSKLTLCIQTMEFLIKELNSSDRLALVSYDTNVRTDFGLTFMNKEGKQMAESCIHKLRAGSATNLSGGLLAGIGALTDGVSGTPNEIQSVLLLTDGLANNGITTTDGIVEAMTSALVVVPRASVYAFGYGTDHNDSMLRSISDAARGTYYFVGALDDVPTAFADCLGGLLSVVGQSIRLTAEVIGTTSRVKKIHSRFPTTVVEEGRRYELAVGDMYAEEDRDILVEMMLGEGQLPPVAEVAEEEQAVIATDDGDTVMAEADAEGGVAEGEAEEPKASEVEDGSIASSIFSFARRLSGLAGSDSKSSDAAAQPAVVVVGEGEALIRFTLEYVDVLAGGLVNVAEVVGVARPDEVANDANPPNVEIMRHINRVTVAEAMDEARVAGEQHDLDRARSVLRGAQNSIKRNLESCGFDEDEDEMASGFMDELRQTEAYCVSRNEYASRGKYVMSSRAQTHSMQRSNEAASAPAMTSYRKAAKMGMVSKWSS